MLLGDGAVAQVVLGNAAREDQFFGGFINIAVGYGLALMVGICIREAFQLKNVPKSGKSPQLS